MYNVLKYGMMISDRRRMEAYANAIRDTIRPGAIVLDIGSGTGIFSMLACKFGAAKVYAVEPAPIIELAKKLAIDNGYSDRIEFIRDISTQVSLSGQVDVIVSDIRGQLPIFEQLIPSIVDARERLLAPQGKLIPSRDALYAGLVKQPHLFRRHADIWESDPFGLNLNRARDMGVNVWQPVELKPEDILCEPKCWATLDYETIRDPNVFGRASWSIKEPATVCGLGLWFDSELDRSHRLVNAPGNLKSVYGHLFVPFAEQVELAAGDVVCIELAANLFGGTYVWSWQTRVYAEGDRASLKAEFVQSNLMGQPLPPAQQAALKGLVDSM